MQYPVLIVPIYWQRPLLALSACFYVFQQQSLFSPPKLRKPSVGSSPAGQEKDLPARDELFSWLQTLRAS